MVTTETPPVTPFTPTANGSPIATPISWADVARQLPPQIAERVLMWQIKELLTELMKLHGDEGCIDIQTDDSDYLGHFVPARAEQLEAERVLPKLSLERWAEIERRERDEKAVTIRELIGSVSTPVAAVQTPES